MGVQKLAEDVRKLEEALIDTYKTLQNKILSKSYLRDNAPQVIDALINGDYSDTKKLREDCQKLVDNIRIKNEKIGFDFEPDLIVKAFKNCE